MFSENSGNNKKTKSNKRALVIAVTAAIIIIAGVIVAFFMLNSPMHRIDNYYNNATKYLAEMNYEQAIVEFDKILEIDPMNVEAYLGKAQAYYEMGDIDKAIEILEYALSLVDDERIREKLNELKLIRNPPPVVTQPVEPEVEVVDNGYVEYEILAVSELELRNLGAGINYIVNEDSTYSLMDINGNKLSDKKYVSIYSFFESDCGNYAVLCPDETTNIIVNDKLETVIDISGAYSWKFFDAANGLVAVTFSGTVTKNDYLTGDEYQEEEKIARLDIYKLDTAELLYRWNYDDWVEGENTEIDLSEVMPYEVKPEDMYCESCGGIIAVNHSEIYINSYYSNINIESLDNKLRIPFSISVDFYVTNMEELREEWAREDERRMQEALAESEDGRAVIGISHNMHEHSGGTNGFYDYYEAVYEDGKIIVKKAEVNGTIKYSDDEYVVYNTNNMPIAATVLRLSEDSGNSYFWHSSEFASAEDGVADEFEWIVNVYNDTAIGGRNTPGIENSTDLAFFKPVWYGDAETAKEKCASEWTRISEWFSGITNYGVHKDGYWLGRYKENSTEEKEYAVFGYNEASDEIIQLSDWYDDISWDEGEYSLVEKEGKFGYIDSNGKEVKMYDDATDFVNGYAMVITKGKAIIVDEEFNQLSEEFDADVVTVLSENIFRINYNDKFTYIRINE